MVLIFAHYYDSEAIWLANSLRQENPGIKINVAVAEALGIDYDTSLNIQKTGAAGHVHFKGDSNIRDEAVTLVINRLVYVNPLIWSKSLEKEKLYATNEINAFFAALIHSFHCPVINAIEHGSVLGSKAGSLTILKAVTQHRMTVHPFLLEENNHAGKLLQTNIDNHLRVMLWENKLFFVPGEIRNDFEIMMTQTFQKVQLHNTYELFFRETGDSFQLISISRSPSLSVYGAPFVQYLSSILNTLQPCY